MVDEHLPRGRDRYRIVLRLPAAKILLVASFIGHVPIGMVTLTLLLGVARASDSYSAGGTAAGLYVVASGVVAPFWGRRTDRVGAWGVLTGMAVAFLAACAVLITALVTRAPLWMILATVVAAGASRPVLPGAAQSLWSHLTVGQPEIRTAAYSLHAGQLGLVWILGPIVVTGFVTAFGTDLGPQIALAAAGALTAAGSLAVALVWRKHGPRDRATVERREPVQGPSKLYSRPYLTMLVSIALFEASVGGGFVAIGIFAEHADVASWTGVLVAIWFTGAMIGTVWFGMRNSARSLDPVYRRLLIAFGASWVLCAVLFSPWQLAIGLFVTGLALSPTHTVQYTLVAHLAPARARAEGFTWLSTTAGAGGAIGSSLTGPAIEHLGGTYAGFILAGVFALLAAATITPVFTGRKEIHDVRGHQTAG